MEEEKTSAADAAAEVVLSSDDEMHLRLMMEASVFYGHGRSRTNPKMRPYILATRSGMEVINLIKTMEALDKATKAIEGAIKAGGTVLLVGTTPATKNAVKDTAIRLGLPYVTERWLGGTLTNYGTISERIARFRKLKADRAAGKLEKYTKKERLDIDKELVKLEELFGGVETLEGMPSLVVVTDLRENEIAAREAKRMHIPVVGVVNTNGNPDIVDFSIPANDRSPKSIALLLSYIEKAVERARNAALAASSAKKTEVREVKEKRA